MKNMYITYKWPLATLIIIILAAGIYAYRNIQNSLFPEITFPKIKIIAENGEQPVDKMMVTVTIPIETEIKKVQHLRMLRSTTSRGNCEFSAFLDWGSDIDLGMQRIESQINEIKNEMPPETKITVEKMNPATLPVMGYSLEIEYGGAYSEQQNAFGELLLILLLAACLVFLTILFIFKNIKADIVIIFISFIGISGSILALFITNTPLNVGSYTGLIMIVGIIGENAIFTFLQYRESHKENNRDAAIIYSISTRLRPNLMTALSAIAALFPLALGLGTGAQMHQPLAISIIGGFVIALPLLLIVLPTFLRVVEKK